MYFQPPGLKFFFNSTGITPGGGSDQPIAVAPKPQVRTNQEQFNGIKALGRLMPFDDIAVVAPPFGAGDARVAKIFVKEGQQVAANDVIAELDSLAQLQSALNTAEANLNVAEARVAQTENQTGSSLKDIVAQRQTAEDEARFALLDFQRISELYQQDLLSRKDYEQAELKLAKAKNLLEQVNAQFERVTGGEHQADNRLAVSQYKLAKAELERANTEMEKAYVRAPKSGTVLRLHVRVGERPGNSGLATLGRTDKMQAELEIYQTDISKVAPGASVSLTSPALAAPLYGTIAQIGLEVERQEIVGASPASNLDARVVKVVVDLDNESSMRAQTLTGLEITAAIEQAAL